MAQLPAGHPVGKAITDLVTEFKDVPPALSRLEALSETMLAVRKEVGENATAKQRLAMLDALIEMEDIVLLESQTAKVETLGELLAQIRILIRVATATGWLELWEWEKMGR